MITRRPADERGRTRTHWLDGRHTFSFNRYYEPRWSGFRELLVINEDRVAPAAGFPPHSHSDMEIITYIISGALEHRDSMGNTSATRTGAGGSPDTPSSPARPAPPPRRASRPTRTATWRSSPTSSPARSSTATAWATPPSYGPASCSA